MGVRSSYGVPGIEIAYGGRAGLTSSWFGRRWMPLGKPYAMPVLLHALSVLLHTLSVLLHALSVLLHAVSGTDLTHLSHTVRCPVLTQYRIWYLSGDAQYWRRIWWYDLRVLWLILTQGMLLPGAKTLRSYARSRTKRGWYDAPALSYTPKSNTRKRISGTKCSEVAVSSFGFRRVFTHYALSCSEIAHGIVIQAHYGMSSTEIAKDVGQTHPPCDVPY
eukprot:3940644-Rhodomonas_salina.6